jgi:peptidoglycan/xylan/chitin deacetylase (PgdA/CDA1 family)
MTQNDLHGLPILTYHSIDSSGSVISTSPENFRKQMEILAKSSMKVLPLREIALQIKENQDLPKNAVTITFDDGFRNLFDTAFPVLKENGFPATVFLVTSFCGKNNRWYGQPDQIPTLELLKWDEIGKMSEIMDFGVHTANHPDLTKISGNRLQDEIQGAREELIQHLGKSHQAFAYPYGKQSAEARKIVEQNFYAACSTEMNFASQNSDLYFLPRIDMYYFSRNSAFHTIGTSRFQRYVLIRRLLRHFRQALTSN